MKALAAEHGGDEVHPRRSQVIVTFDVTGRVRTIELNGGLLEVNPALHLKDEEAVAFIRRYFGKDAQIVRSHRQFGADTEAEWLQEPEHEHQK